MDMGYKHFGLSKPVVDIVITVCMRLSHARYAMLCYARVSISELTRSQAVHLHGVIVHDSMI